MAQIPEALPRPPRWAESLLRACLSPSDRDSVSGDLLEQYRDTVRPSRGGLRAGGWYLGRVAAVFGGLVWPGLVLLTVPAVGFAVSWAQGDALGFFSRVPRALPAPGVSLVDAAIYMWTAYYAARRTRLVRAGLLAAAVCCLLNLALMFTALAVRFDLVQTMIAKPGIDWLVILAAYLGIGLAFSAAAGLVGATLGRALSPWRRASL